jgi:hypothetical protein
MKNATFAAILAVAVTGGIVAAHFLGSGHDGITRDRAIALAQLEIQGHDPEAVVIDIQSGPFEQFWYPGSTDFAAPAAQRVWAIAFRGRFDASCGPPPSAGERPNCPPPNRTMMVVLNYTDGSWIEDASPISGFDTLASKVEKVMNEEAAKPRFTGKLGDFVVYARGGDVPAEARLFVCPGGEGTTRVDRAGTTLRSEELWSSAFDTEEGVGWACPERGVVLVNNQGLEGETTDGEMVAKIRGYFSSVPVPVLRDAPRDRLELVTVEGRPGLLEHPIEGYPYGLANLAVIERNPEGDTPGIVVFVEGASSAKRAIEIAEEIMS